MTIMSPAKAALLAASLAAGAISSAAHAGFSWEGMPPRGSQASSGPSATPSAETPAADTGVSKGREARRPPLVRAGDKTVNGFGRDIPLDLALRQMVPAHLEIHFDEGVDPQTRITWTGGQSWSKTLDRALSASGLTGHRTDKSLRISKAVQAAAPEAPAPEVQSPPKPDAPSSPIPLAGPAGPLHAAPAAPADSSISRTWVVNRGSTLRETLEQWAAAANWGVAWNTKRVYPIEASATFTGTFEQAAAELLRAFTTAVPPIDAEFSANRWVIVTTPADGRR
jgi:Toxin co-regulated pilus biosynthesis protein Q